MRIGFASYDWAMSVLDASGAPTLGGSGWYRCGLPAAGLRAIGHEAVVGRLASRPSGEFVVRTWDGVVHDSLDLIVLQRWMQAEVVRDMRKARALGQVLVNDVDDWFFGLDQRNRAFWASHPKVNPDENREHYRAALLSSDALTVSTPYLGRRLDTLGRPIIVLRNAIDLERWTPQEPQERDRLTVGWVGATAWRSGDLETLRGVLGPFLRAHRARFRHCGALDAGEGAMDAIGLEPADCLRARPMRPIATYPRLFRHLDIGLVPLADVPFNHAKSAIKGIEYSAAGVPFVAQGLPEYEFYAADACARRPRDWIRALERLTDLETRRAVHRANLLRAASQDIALRAYDWANAYRHILSGVSTRATGVK